MMNTQKVLLILGGLFLGAALATYLMFLQADNRAAEEARKAGAEGDIQATQPAPVDSSISENHVTQGSIDPSQAGTRSGTQSGTQSGGAISKSMAATQQAVEAAPAPAVAPSPAPVSNAPGTLTQQQLQEQLRQAQRELKQLQLEQAQQQARLQAQLSVPAKAAPSTAVASVNAQDPSAASATQGQRPRRSRDELQRRMMTGATPETMELVRESAKLDPSLPPPDMSAVQAAMDHAAATDNTSPQPYQPQQQARASKPGAGSNSIAASMTDQLVRDSAKLDPSLPPPGK